MNDHIEKLKKLRAPWWSRLLGDWRARRAAKRYRISALKHRRYITTANVWSNIDGKVYPSFFILYEKGDGIRTFEFVKAQGWASEDIHSQYSQTIIPWVNHHYTNKQIIEWAEKTKVMPKV